MCTHYSGILCFSYFLPMLALSSPLWLRVICCIGIALPLGIALLFGAIISATDPISVIAIFKDLKVDKRLAVIIEGESLINDGTAVVLFQILLASILAGNVGIAKGIGQFALAVVGGASLGSAMGYLVSKIAAKIDDPEVWITLTTVAAYGSYLLAGHLHLSGVIATASAGLMVGNFRAKSAMSADTRTADGEATEPEAALEYV